MSATASTPSSPLADVRNFVRDYREFHQHLHGKVAEARRHEYRTMVNDLYFNLVTDFYEFGWGRSFHFAPRRKHESFHGSLQRLEHVVAASLQVSRGARIVDVGCGVGGPMVTIARATGARVTGINLSDVQIARGNGYLARAKLADRCEFVQADYMHMPFSPATFDAAYTLCALPHAPDKKQAYAEIARVLKPGAILAGTDWCMTSAYDATSPAQQEIKRKIQLGSALPDIESITELREHLDADFEVLSFRDIVEDSDPETPWYLPLSSRERSIRGLTATPVGRTLTQIAARGLERIGLAPRGTSEVSQFLIEGADGLVQGGETGIFTIVSFVARKRP